MNHKYDMCVLELLLIENSYLSLLIVLCHHLLLYMLLLDELLRQKQN